MGLQRVGHDWVTFTVTFPGGPVVKNPPFKAGDQDSIPCQGIKIPDDTEQLSLCATTTEPKHWRPHGLQGSACKLQRKTLNLETKTWYSQINKIF